MSQFKTTPEVLHAYASLLERHNAAGLKGAPPWKFNGRLRGPCSEPMFTGDCAAAGYEFPVGIVEGKHVWIGDIVYARSKTEPMIVITESNCDHILYGNCMLEPEPVAPRVSGQNPPYDGTTDAVLVAFLTETGTLIHCEVNSRDYNNVRRRNLRRVPREDKRVTITSEAV